MAKIMIVDDDLQASGLLERVVRMHKHQAIVVNKSVAAMETAIAQEPELFLLDVMMPEINGYELCVLLRAEPKFAKAPIIDISALDDGDSKEQALKAGANGYLTKPFNIIEIGDIMAELLAAAK